MPTPDQIAKLQRQIPPEMLAALSPHGAAQSGEQLAAELAALRGEMAALRALLEPPSAVILTGQPVREHYMRLACTCMTSTGPDYCMRHAA